MIKKRGNPISGGRGQFRPTPNVLSDSAQTSRDAQKLVRATPSPFQNRQGAANIPAPTNPAYRANPRFHKQGLAYGATGRAVSVRKAPRVNLGAVGEPRLPKGYNPIISGFPTSPRAPRTAGKISTNKGPSASGKEFRRMRSEYPGIFGRTEWRP